MSEIKIDLINKLLSDFENYNLNLKLGLIYTVENNYIEAKKIFTKLINIDSKRYEAFLNLSNIEAIERNYSYSEGTFNKFIDKNGYNKEIINGLATLYYSTKNYSKLEKLLKKYFNYEKNYLLFFYQGILCDLNNETSKQIISFEKSIELNKKFWESYERLFHILEKTNRLVKFKKLLELGNNYFKKNTKYNYFESLYQHRVNINKESLKIILEKKIENNLIKKSNVNYLINLYDLLSKIHIKLKNYDLSLEYALKRNKISLSKSKNKQIDKKILLNVLKKYKHFYSSNIYQNNKVEKNGILHNNITFLLGFPRSGTTLLDNILRSHSKTIVLEEKPYLINIRHKFFKNNTLEKISNITQDEITNLQKEYINSFEYDHKKMIIDKFPLNLTEIGFIKTIFPESKIILVLRHPLDTILSCVLTSFKINEAMANYENLDTAAHFYNETFKLFEIYKKYFDLDYHSIKYENIVINFKKEIQGLLNYLNLDFEDNLNKFYKTALERKVNTPSYHQVVRPLYKDSLNRYQKFNKTNKIKPIIEEWIKKFNYKII